jgi:hypothetical protein
MALLPESESEFPSVNFRNILKLLSENDLWNRSGLSTSIKTYQNHVVQGVIKQTALMLP